MMHAKVEVAPIQPNMLMFRFLLAVRKQARDGGHLAALTGLDPLETNIAVAVGKRQGWLTEDCKLTDAGLTVIRPDKNEPIPGIFNPSRTTTKISFSDLYLDRNGLSKSVYAQVKLQMPRVMMAALEEIHVAGGGYENFENRHDLPSRSAKAIVQLAIENYNLIMGRIL
jgi:hypothetical protein